MRAWSFLVVLAGLAGLCGCNGPKDTCQGSVESYYALLKDHDWEGIYDMLTPEYRKKVRSAANLAGTVGEDWTGAKSFSIALSNVAQSDANGVCIANGTMSYTVKIRGQNPVDVTDTYFSWTFKLQKDGKWYIELPGEEKLSGY